ncbi:C-type lectin domain family 7 member A-like isoform X2 [Alligator sinensis]|uniref:C-type lectin domain family 7 member A-like isoform X2 n=1 Tax=Alligator sinensis TaxID=38654 RepID=A0A3Q0FZ92_ALLSI|nr:C-type lectin domain family 7 member A-like isoform X2 [Alligator sinensis]
MQHPGDTSAPSVRRQPTSLILGILCLVLLMATGVLGYLGEKCPARWVVHKDSSYLFSPEKGTWEKCHSSCISQSAQLLTTEGGEELDFIKKESFHYFEDHDGVTQYHTFWIGLSYDPGSRKWVWADDSDLSSGLNGDPSREKQLAIGGTQIRAPTMFHSRSNFWQGDD